MSHTAREPNPYLPVEAEVVLVTREAHDVKTFRFEPVEEDRALEFVPGQFLVVSILGVGESAISIASSPTDGPWAELTVRNVGRVTAALHHGPAGGSIGLRGPFGNGFDTKSLEGRPVVLLAGGIGLAPLRSLVRFINDTRDRFGPLALVYGAKTPDDRLYKDELEAWNRIEGNEVFQIVEEKAAASWTGPLGVAGELVEKLGAAFDGAAAVVCGPEGMLKPGVAALESRGAAPRDIQVVLERRVSCGIGKCGHCYTGGKLVCIDGPVFTAEQFAAMAEPWSETGDTA